MAVLVQSSDTDRPEELDIDRCVCRRYHIVSIDTLMHDAQLEVAKVQLRREHPTGFTDEAAAARRSLRQPLIMHWRLSEL